LLVFFEENYFWFNVSIFIISELIHQPEKRHCSK
jgi:hypothetical protein